MSNDVPFELDGGAALEALWEEFLGTMLEDDDTDNGESQ